MSEDDRNFADMVTQVDPAVHSGSARGELGADGESDTQTVPSMDGESGASAASGDDPGRCGEPSFEDLALAAGVLRAGFMSLDAVDFEDFFRRRANVMRSVPRFLRGPLRSVLRCHRTSQGAKEVGSCRQQREVEFHTRGVVGFDREGTGIGSSWRVVVCPPREQSWHPATDAPCRIWKDASVIEERVSRWTIKHDERASETSLGFSAGHSPLVLGGRAVSCGTHHGSAVVRSSEGRHRTFSVRPLHPGRVRVRGT